MTLILSIIVLGLMVGILVGLLGIGGGVVLVPAMVYLLHFDQHMAQGTSLFILLPPIGLGALRGYWKNGQVDLRAGIICAVGFLLGGYIGGRIAVPMASKDLQAIFGFFLMLSALLLWRKTRQSARVPVSAQGQAEGVRDTDMISEPRNGENSENESKRSYGRDFGIFLIAGFSGVAAGMVGIGGGVLLVPLLGLLFGFSQHKAQGTSLVALIPPTGLLAFLLYAKAGYISWQTGFLLIPGVFLGGILGAKLAKTLNPKTMRQVFAAAMAFLGIWQVFSAWHS
jgi:uncharacterized protein